MNKELVEKVWIPAFAVMTGMLMVKAMLTFLMFMTGLNLSALETNADLEVSTLCTSNGFEESHCWGQFSKSGKLIYTVEQNRNLHIFNIDNVSAMGFLNLGNLKNNYFVESPNSQLIVQVTQDATSSPLSLEGWNIAKSEKEFSIRIPYQPDINPHIYNNQLPCFTDFFEDGNSILVKCGLLMPLVYHIRSNSWHTIIEPQDFSDLIGDNIYADSRVIPGTNMSYILWFERSFPNYSFHISMIKSKKVVKTIDANRGQSQSFFKSYFSGDRKTLIAEVKGASTLTAETKKVLFFYDVPTLKLRSTFPTPDAPFKISNDASFLVTNKDGINQIWDLVTKEFKNSQNLGSVEAISKNNFVLYITKIKSVQTPGSTSIPTQSTQTKQTVNISIRDTDDKLVHEIINVCPADKPELAVALSQDGKIVLANCYYINFFARDNQVAGSANSLYLIKFKDK